MTTLLAWLPIGTLSSCVTAWRRAALPASLAVYGVVDHARPSACCSSTPPSCAWSAPRPLQARARVRAARTGVRGLRRLLVMTRGLAPRGHDARVTPRRWWLRLLPPAWFASYLELARGGARPLDWVPAAHRGRRTGGHRDGRSAGRVSSGVRRPDRRSLRGSRAGRATRPARRRGPAGGSGPASSGPWRCSSGASSATTSGSVWACSPSCR